MIHTNSKKGFTLIEVMVSASILALLAAIIFANINQGRVKAAEVKALEELRQISTSLELYKSDHNNYPNFSGKISESGIKNDLVPQYIPEVIEDTEIPGNVCKDVEYYSENGVAQDSTAQLVFRCGPRGNADDFIIFYPTKNKVNIENAVFFNGTGETMAWGVLSNLESSNGKCHLFGSQNTLAENGGNPMTLEDYEILSSLFDGHPGKYNLKCINFN